MKKITLIFILLAIAMFSWQSNAQTICTQSFTASGTDDAPTTVTVAAADITCNNGESINTITLVNSGGNLTNGFCNATGSSWYNFTLNINGTDVITGCAADLNNYTVPVTFTTLTVTSTDTDNWSDNITISFDLEVNHVTPSCQAPTSLAVSAILTTQATVTWTELNTPVPAAEYVAVPTGDPAPTGAGTTLTNGGDITGLTPSSVYDLYVRDDCGGGDFSTWSNLVTFTTQCVAFTDFSENFDATTNGELPICWSSMIMSTDTAARVEVNTGEVEFFNGADTTSDLILITPQLTDLPNDTHRIRFNASGPVGTAMQIGTMDSPTGTFTPVFGVALSTTDTEYAYSYNASTTDSYVALKAVLPIASNTVKVNSFIWEPTPACIEPSNLYINTITSSGATITWTDTNLPSETEWDLYIVPTGDAAPNAASTPTLNDETSATVVWTGGIANTDYDVYVRTDCGADNTTVSTWTGPVNFTTICSTFTAPYTEDFEDAGDIDSCWTQETTDDLDWTAHMGGTASSNTGPSGANTGDYYIYVESSSPVVSGDVAAIVSPMIDLTALTTPRLNFYYHMFGAAMDTDGSVDVAISTDGGTTYASIFNQAGNQGNQWNQALVDLSSYTGVVSFKITGTVSTTGSTFQNDFAIDDFKVEETPSTVPPCATNVVITEVDANCGNMGITGTWDATAGADGYKLTVGTTPGGNDIMDMVDLGNVTTFTSGATPLNTTFFYTLTPYNLIGDATGCTEGTITTSATGCYCDSDPTSNDNSGITNVQIGTTDFATTDVTYFDHTATTVDMMQGINNNVQVTFATGYSYHTNIWIDMNDDYTFDASELVFQGESVYTNPTTLDASFILPASVTLGQHRMRIGTSDFGQATPNPCYSGAYGVTLDFTINVIVATCNTATATGTVVADCVNSQFSVDVDVTVLGDATEISDGTNTWPITATGVITAGPYNDGETVVLTVVHSDTTCNFNNTYTNTCPAANDECDTAIVLTVENEIADYASSTPVAATILGATDSGLAAGSCNGTANDDVWFSFVATSAALHITVDDAFDGVVELYSGADCTSLTMVDCDDFGTNPQIDATGLTVGDTYFARVFYYYSTVTSTPAFSIAVWSPDVSTVSTNDLQSVGFNYYPNPVNDTLTMTANENITSVAIFNMLGQEVKNEQLSTLEAQIDMSNLANGTYFVKAQVGQSIGTFKIVKK